MNVPKITLLCLTALLSTAITYSQSNYQAQMDSIFVIPAGKVTTGILIDRSPAVIDLKGYNGDSTAICNTQHWLEIFYRLYASYLNPADFNYDLTLANKYLSPNIDKTHINKIPIGIIYYRYNKIKPFAVRDGLLAVDTINSRIIDISGAGQTPLMLDTCLAVSSLIDTVRVGINRFYIDNTLFVSNIAGDIKSIQIDFDNGQGFMSVSVGDTVNIAYSAAGSKNLIIKVTTSTKTYTVYANIMAAQTAYLAPSATDDMPVPDFGPDYFDNNGIRAYYGIWYGQNHTTIQKPILIASGFDPNNIIRISDEDPEMGDKRRYLYNIANKNNFLDLLRAEGYDIIIYRSANSTASVITNGVCLANFIQEKIINVKTTDEKLVVIGASMGGLTARYALTYMEHNAHLYTASSKIRLFISLDSPQNGANVPLGFQYMVHYLNEDTGKKIEMLNTAEKNALNSVAAREMLIYHHSATQGQTAKCSPNRTTYLSSLAYIGNFPNKCTTAAFSFGSGNGTTQGFSAGATLINVPSTQFIGLTAGLTIDAILAILGIPPTASATASVLDWHFKTNAVPAQTQQTIYNESLDLTLCIPKTKVYYKSWWILLGWPPIVVVYIDCNNDIYSHNITVNNTLPLDNAPGSRNGWHNLTDFKAGSVAVLANIFTPATVIDTHYDCFIPSFSALGLNVHPHTNIANYLNNSPNVTKVSDVNNYLYHNLNTSVSPFDYLYIENYNDAHIYNKNGEGVFSNNMLDAMYYLISNKIFKKDLIIRDDSQDDGIEPNTNPIKWNSPDIKLHSAETGNVITNLDTYRYSYCFIRVKIKDIGINHMQGNERLHLFWSKPILNSIHGHTFYPVNRITPTSGLPLFYVNQITDVTAADCLFTLPDNTPYAQLLTNAFVIERRLNWGFSIMAVADEMDGKLPDFVHLLNFPFDGWNNFAQQYNSIAVSNGNRLLIDKDYSNVVEVVPAMDRPFSLRVSQLSTIDKYVLNDFAELNILLSNDLIKNLDFDKSGVKQVNENTVYVSLPNAELFFNPLKDEKGLYFAGAEVHFISDKMPELNEFDFDMSLVTDGELDESMRITAIRDADVYFKAHVEVNKPRVVKTKEEVTLTANQIFADAEYTWYNDAGEIVGSGWQITLMPDHSQTYRIEIIQKENGFKSYDEVQVIVVDGVIKSLAPNPAADKVTVSYLLSDNAIDASIQISDMYGNVSVSYPLSIYQTEQQIPLYGLIPGTYLVKLVISGTVVDSQNLLKK